MTWLNDNLMMVLTFAFLAWMVWGRVVRPKMLGIKKMTPEIYQSIRNEPHTLVDVRTEGEWRGGRAANAIHIPLADIEKRMRSIPKNKPVVVICASGMRSSMAATTLAKSGYTPVYNFAGGMGSWRSANLPTK